MSVGCTQFTPTTVDVGGAVPTSESVLDTIAMIDRPCTVVSPSTYRSDDGASVVSTPLLPVITSELPFTMVRLDCAFTRYTPSVAPMVPNAGADVIVIGLFVSDIDELSRYTAFSKYITAAPLYWQVVLIEMATFPAIDIDELIIVNSDENRIMFMRTGPVLLPVCVVYCSSILLFVITMLDCIRYVVSCVVVPFRKWIMCVSR